MCSVAECLGKKEISKCLCFFSLLQDVTVTNGTAELLHTEHIWYPRIREVMWELPFAVTLSSSS